MSKLVGVLLLIGLAGGVSAYSSLSEDSEEHFCSHMSSLYMRLNDEILHLSKTSCSGTRRQCSNFIISAGSATYSGFRAVLDEAGCDKPEEGNNEFQPSVMDLQRACGKVKQLPEAALENYQYFKGGKLNAIFAPLFKSLQDSIKKIVTNVEEKYC